MNKSEEFMNKKHNYIEWLPVILIFYDLLCTENMPFSCLHYQEIHANWYIL